MLPSGPVAVAVMAAPERTGRLGLKLNEALPLSVAVTLLSPMKLAPSSSPGMDKNWMAKLRPGLVLRQPSVTV